MASDVAIKVENLSKCYTIYNSPRDRLKQFILPRLQRALGMVSRQYYREYWALKDVSFEVKKGETIGIIGRNGSGKSTLLQLICGTLNPTTGNVQTHGRIAALLELGSGFNPEFSGRENIYLNGTILGLSDDEIDARFADIVAFADIGDFIEQPVKTYSSGMYVRLAFAVQAMVDPDIFIVDEALAVGDEKFQRKCYARLEELKSRGTAILFVSHSSQSVIELCDKTLLLNEGIRLLFCQAPEAIQAYQKLIYASADEQKRLIPKLLATDMVGQKNGVQNFKSLQSKENIGDVNLAGVSNLPSGLSLEAFDPCLIPETTTVYPSQGAVIDVINIVNTGGQVVNMLRLGEDYHFDISGRFSKHLAGVYFGIHIKSASGAVITGQRFPQEGRLCENVTAGQTFKVRFSFRMNLLPGVYFVGSGIWSVAEPNCVHRIIDALMFRVCPNESNNSFGYVDLLSAEPTVQFEDSLHGY